MTSINSSSRSAHTNGIRETEGRDVEPEKSPQNLRRGSEGEEVEALQKRLEERGYRSEEGGAFGQRTEDAVRRFQRDRGLAVDGIVGPQTREALEKSDVRSESQRALAELPADTHFRWASSGEGVRRLQDALNARGANLEVDGKYGRSTTDAIRDFQKENGLKVDGIAGPQTIGALIRTQKAQASEAPANAERGRGPRRPPPNVHASAAAAKANETIDHKATAKPTTPAADTNATPQAASAAAEAPKTETATPEVKTQPPAQKPASTNKTADAPAAEATKPAAAELPANTRIPVVSDVVDSIGRAGQGMTQGLQSLGQAIGPALGGAAKAAGQTGQNLTSGLQQGIDQIGKNVGPAVTGAMENLGQAGQNLASGLQQGLNQAGQNLGQMRDQIQQGLQNAGAPLAQRAAAQKEAQAAAQAREIAATQTEIKDAPAGAVIDNPLNVQELRAPQGSAKDSAPMAIFDNPETIHTTGLIGSTIADQQAGRSGQTGFEFNGEGRLYSLVNNRTHDKGLGGLVSGLTGNLKNVENSVIAYNPSDKPLTLELEGVMYSKSITKTDGKIHHEYKKDGDFRGPHAITASSYMAKDVGENGYVKKSITIPPRSAAVVANVKQAPGGEAFTLLDFKADGKFRLAQAVTDEPLNKEDLQRVVDGSFPTAGSPTRADSKKGDFIAAGPNELGRPNGVALGSVFRGGGEVNLEPGRVHGEMFLSTRFKQAEEQAPDLLPLQAVAGNKGSVGDAARSNDGSFGMTYDLRYALNNPSDKARRVQVVLTAPGLANDGPFNPGGGMLTLPVKMDGEQHNLRVSKRHTGVVIGTVEVPPGSTKDLALEFTNLGNLFPPAGIELRTLPEGMPEPSAQ